LETHQYTRIENQGNTKLRAASPISAEPSTRTRTLEIVTESSRHAIPHLSCRVSAVPRSPSECLSQSVQTEPETHLHPAAFLLFFFFWGVTKLFDPFFCLSHVAHTCCSSPILHSFGISPVCTPFIGVTLPYTPTAESVMFVLRSPIQARGGRFQGIVVDVDIPVPDETAGFGGLCPSALCLRKVKIYFLTKGMCRSWVHLWISSSKPIDRDDIYGGWFISGVV
jgi:hypothetical protein